MVYINLEMHTGMSICMFIEYFILFWVDRMFMGEVSLLTTSKPSNWWYIELLSLDEPYQTLV